MKLFTIIIALIFLLSCKNDEKVQFKNPIKPKLESQEKVPKKAFESSKTGNVKDEIKSVKRELSIKASIENITFNGLKLKDSKLNMLSKMGEPNLIKEPKYECGPFSEDWQEIKFYQYFYDNMNFIVYEKSAEIQEIEFKSNEVIKINGKKIKVGMTLEEICKKLGIELNGEYFKNRVLIYPKEDLDEHYFLEFKNNKIYRFDRYEPC